MAYALDTNTIILYLRNDSSVMQKFDESYLQGHDFIVPKVVDYEMRRGFQIKSAPNKESAYDIFIQEFYVAELDNAVWDKAKDIYAELYLQHFTVGDLDILIAATCLANGYTLVTTNKKDFENIDGLEIVDWTT